MGSNGQDIGEVAVYLLEGDVEGRDDPAFERRLRQEVIFGIIAFEIDYLSHLIGVLPAQRIEDAEKGSVGLHLCAFGLGRVVLYIIPAFVLGSAA